MAPPPTRPKAAQALATRYYFYSPEMNLLAETELKSGSGAPAVLYEYIWFNGHPVAQIDSGTTTYWTFTDHLGTPILQLTSTASVYWRGEYEPYGRIFSTPSGNQHQPLRLPGQEAEQLSPGDTPNGTTERSYNIFRWYRFNWGRYTQADPIGIHSDGHPFSYGSGNPLIGRDPLGLFVIVGCGNGAPIVHNAFREAMRTTKNCLKCDGQSDRMRTALTNSTLRCSLDLPPGVCGQADGEILINSHVVTVTARRGMSAQATLGNGGPCPCLPALLAHEGAHEAFGPGEAVPERIERKCFKCGTPPGPGELQDVGP